MRLPQWGAPVKAIVRAILAFVVFASVYIFTYWVPFSWDLSSSRDEFLANMVSLAAGLSAGWFVWTRTRSAPAGLFASMTYGAAVVGAISFSAGFFGPMLLTDSGQGPLLGLFITGPLGAIIGAIAGGLAWARRRRSTPAT